MLEVMEDETYLTVLNEHPLHSRYEPFSFLATIWFMFLSEKNLLSLPSRTPLRKDVMKQLADLTPEQAMQAVESFLSMLPIVGDHNELMMLLIEGFYDLD